MSIFSIASSSPTSGLATVFSNGYRFTTRRSIIPTPFSRACLICSGLSLTASIPPWTLGFKVFILPSISSGKSVSSVISFTAVPLSLSSLKVPPVEKISTPFPSRYRASSAAPALSDKEIIALFISLVPIYSLSSSNFMASG